MLKSELKGLLKGTFFINGDAACAEGAICAGCRFAAGYPITPSTEVVERLARRFPMVGGLFVQMEDEISSSIAIIGAAWGGAKAMTVTSGPGMSLMMEHIGFAVMTETPCVFVNVQRGGPSTGLPTLPGQQDVMQAKWGSHGDYQIIVLCPNSPQEAFDLTIKAFNLSERFRSPVILLMDEAVGHMLEKVVIPPVDKIEIWERKYTRCKPGNYQPYEDTSDHVPHIAPVGHGYNFHITGLTHDERGYPVMNSEAQRNLLWRLRKKILNYEEFLTDYELNGTGEAFPILLFSYGITSRVATKAMEEAINCGIKIGHMRIRTVWPFPAKALKKVIREKNVQAIVVPELNLGQLVHEVERVEVCQIPVYHVPHAGGTVHEPEEIFRVINQAWKKLQEH